MTAREEGASDVHITVGVPPRMRVNGRIANLDYPSLSETDCSKIIYSIMDDRQMELFRDNKQIEFALSVPKAGRYRVSAFMQKGLPACAIRLVTDSVSAPGDIGVPKELIDICDSESGLVILGGVAGSGKSTTIASIIDYINENKCVHILTLEDPIEYVHTHKNAIVNQREVGIDVASYDEGLKLAIICAGYKQYVIKEWFADYFLHNSDITFDFTKGSNDMIIHEQHCEPWKVTVVDTGLNTMTGGRIKRVQKYVGNEPFLMTYGDGVCDVDISKLVEFHKEHGKIATLTSVMLEQQKGVLDIGGDNAVKSFREKSVMDGAPINAGYMVLNPEIFDYIEGDNTVFEKDPLEKLAKEGQLMSYMHNGFWQCMDNKREMDMLEKYLSTGTAPWKKW